MSLSVEICLRTESKWNRVMKKIFRRLSRDEFEIRAIEISASVISLIYLRGMVTICIL